ncbi:hypothetical protein AB1Y20_023434 [Prymnesium parvum]|uniref:Integrase catalytic domain-containing protein n=1 Tax=Prymnesium parvum TaxID=97485 RepID=A0AB34JFD5_PRYPA
MAPHVKNYGDCVNVDIAGPFEPSFAHGNVYLHVFIDTHTNFGDVYFSKTKSYDDSIPIRKRFVNESKRYGGVRHFHSDGAKELMGEMMKAYLDDQGITCSWTVANEPNLNNRAEGYIGRLTERGRPLDLPHRF